MRINQMKSAFITLISFALITLIASSGCNSAGDSEDEESTEATASTTTTAIPTGTTTVSNALSGVYPTSLAISILPETVGSSLYIQETETKMKRIDDKIQDNRDKLNGSVSSCLSKDLFQKSKQDAKISCYQFDSDMNPMQAPDGKIFGTTDGTVSGSVRGDAGTSKEACMVAFAREQVQDAVDTVDKSLDLVSGLLCQSKKDGSDASLPEINATLDLTTTLAKAGDGFLTINTATITRLEDVNSLPVYRTDITIVGPDGGAMEVHLVHSPGEGDNGKGILFTKQSGGNVAKDPGGGNNSSNKNFVMSINYDRTVEDGNNIMRFEVRRGAIVNTVDPFTSSGLVNYDAVGQSAQNSEIHAINYVAFDMNVDTGAGTLSYWMNPGGNYIESARGFVFKIDQDTGGILKGCGVSGATSNISVRKALADSTDLKPTNYWHPFENSHAQCDNRYPCVGNGLSQTGTSVTIQCFKQDSSGVYLVVDSTTGTTTNGYAVVESNANPIAPPTKPKNKIEGSFQPPK